MYNFIKSILLLTILFSSNTFALTVGGCLIQPSTSCAYKNLSSSNLSNVDISSSNFMYATFYDVDLTEANLSNSNLRFANLTLSNLNDANLQGAILRNTNLQNATLINTDLSYANIVLSDLKNTDLTGANLVGTNLSSLHNLHLATFANNPYNHETQFPNGFNPQAYNMTYVPIPAGIYFFLSGFFGLGFIKKIK